jgi:hypothetical protein
MPRKSKTFLRRSAAAKKGAKARARNQANEWAAIEQLLSEEFESLKEAREALAEETGEDDYVDVIGIDSLYE